MLTVGKAGRRRRTDPSSIRAVRLTDRDLEILETISKLRFSTTSQLARLYFGSRAGANKRLRKLLDARLIRAWVRDLAEDNVYSLDRRGAALLGKANEGGEKPPVARGLDGNLDHLLAINDVRLWLALGLGNVGGELAWWRSDWELRSNFREGLVPDALFAIRWPNVPEQAYTLEVDNNSRSARAFLKKLLRYAAVGERSGGLYGVRDFLTLVVLRDARWLERYQGVAVKTPGSGRVWFATLSTLRNEGVDAAVWVSAEGVALSLRDLDCRPYSTEGLAPENPEETRS